MHWLRGGRHRAQPVVQGASLAPEESDGVGVPVGSGVLVGVTDLAGVVRELGLGVLAGVLREDGSGVAAGGDVAGAGVGRAEGCTAGVTPTVAADGGLTHR